DSKKFEMIELTREELVVIASMNHPLAKKSVIELEEILKYPFITREPTSGTRIETERLLRHAGIEPAQLRIHLEFATTEAIITAVSEGIGISIISSIAAFKAAAANRIKAIRIQVIPSPVRSLYLVRMRQKTSDRLLDLFWNFVKDYVKSKMGIEDRVPNLIT
ncbi:MAG: LysR substrate-binding domain-containing protein, partial [Candidatus Helarchaeales archaeon]